MELKDLCGRGKFSGCEMKTEMIEDYYGTPEETNVCLFTLNGVTYKAVENLDDGYRSYCNELEISDEKPCFTFPEIEVVCEMMPDTTYGSGYEENDVLVIKDAESDMVVLEVGTRNVDDYYPVAHFEYHPENMSCNMR